MKENKKAGYELSAAQRRLWILSRFEGADHAYNIPEVMRLEGYLNREAFEQACQQVTARHETLRTIFIEDAWGNPLQRIFKPEEYTFQTTFTDLSNDHSALNSIIRGEMSHQFDFGIPLLRCHLIQLTPTTHIWVLVMHHIISDEWSMGVFAREFSHYYNGYVKGQPTELPPLRIQYKDYAAWHTKQLTSVNLERHKRYWLNQFSGEIPVLELPGDFPRPDVKTFNGATIEAIISRAVADEFTRQSNTLGGTLFIHLMACVNTLLYRYTGQTDIVIGSPSAGREHPDLQGQMGYYVNTLALRTNINSGASYEQLYQSVKQVALAAYEHQVYPYDDLVNTLQLRRDTGRNPLFDVMVVLQNAEQQGANIELSGLEITIGSPVDHNIAKFDLTFSFKPTPQGLNVLLEYNSDIYTHDRAAKMLRHLEQIAASASGNPKQTLREIPMLGANERQYLIHELNETKSDFRCAQTLAALFEAQAAKSPEAIAMVFEGSEWTYQHLNEISNRLAYYISQNYAIQPDDLVGIQLKRSEWLVISVLGVLKSGGAYLPIDADYPTERIDFMISDSGCKKLIDEGELEKFLAAVHSYDTANPAVASQQNNLAYCIYTSGSTGVPKGVLVEQASVVNYLNWTSEYTRGDTRSHVHMVSTLSFDFTVTILFGALLNGKTLIVHPQDANIGEVLNAIIADPETPVVKLTPAHIQLLDTQLLTESAARSYVIGGEALTTEQIRILRLSKGARIFNEYGPTEATVGCVVKEIAEDNNPLIGRPIANTQVYLLDGDLNLVPHGVPGELCIGGAGLARGYLNRTELTAEKFIPHPYASGERIYRSGDLAKWNAEGELEYLGRIDEQVKIRGFRIETGEIEAVLHQHSEVDQAVVIARAVTGADKVLIAYTTGTAKTEALRDYLQNRLPAYMVPTYYVHLVSVPLTSNGKVDRKSLPMPERNESNPIAIRIAPATEIEKLLATIWCQVLHVPLSDVSTASDFFDLGGDSIKAIQMSARMREAGYDLRIAQIMGNSMMAAMAAQVKVLARLIDQAAVIGDAPLSPIQREFFDVWYPNVPGNDINHYNQSFLLHFPGGISEAYVQAIFQKITAHHDALRMVYQRDESGWQQQSRRIDENRFEIEVIDLKTAEIPFASLEAIGGRLQAEVNITNGGLIKLGLFQMADGDRLLIIIHHLLIDLVSWRILLEDISTLYWQIKGSKKMTLPGKTDSFRYWVERNKHAYESAFFKKEIGYWSGIDSTSADSILIDHVTGQNSFSNAVFSTVKLSREETTFIQNARNGQNKIDINALLLTALSESFSIVFKIKRIKINLESHGRDELAEGIDVSRTIGWFTSIYPILLEVTEEAISAPMHALRVNEMLKQVPRKGIGYGILKHDRANELHGGKPAQITFNYLGEFSRQQQSGDDQVFELSDSPHGANICGNLPRNAELDVTGQSVDGEMTLSIIYSRERFNSGTIDQLTEQFKKSLLAVSAGLTAVGAHITVPGDFTFGGLTFEQINTLEKVYGKLDDVYELSPMQAGLYYHAVSDSASTAYFIQTSYRLKGTIDAQLLRESYSELIIRHPVLRSVFPGTAGDNLVQIVLTNADAKVVYEDITHLNTADQDQFIDNFKSKDLAKGFNISQGPLIRLIVVRLSGNEYEMIWSSHHLILDGWSTSLLIAEYYKSYCSKALGKVAVLPQLRPYSAYIKWLSNYDTDRSASYWRDYLEGFDASTGIPVTMANEGTDFKVANFEFELDEATTNELQLISSNYKVTLNSLLQSLWGVFVGKYNHADDVVFGSVVSGRPPALEGIRETIGLFINTVPQRIKFAGNTRFHELIRTTQDSYVSGEPYHHMNLGEIQRLSARGMGLINHVFVFDNYPVSDISLTPDDDGQELPVLVPGSAKVFDQLNYDFAVTMAPGRKLFVQYKYNLAKYTPEFIARLGSQFEQLTRLIVANPEIKIADMTFLSAEELQHLLNDLNNTEVDYGADTTLVALFEEQAAHTPNQIAVAYKDRSLTFAELNQLSSQLAVYLQKTYQVGANDFVGIKLDRSEWLIVSVLGVLKAGGAYVPIDPEYPEERVEFMVKDSGCKVLLNESELDYFIMVKDLLGQTNVEVDLKPNDLAYCIYTSGSTGTPKGVLVEHAGIVNYLKWTSEYTKGDARNVIHMFSTLSFDFTVTILFGALLNGKTLRVHPQGADIGQILNTIIADPETPMVKLTPAHIQLLDTRILAESASRSYIIGGEALSTEQIKILRLNKGARIFNEYGPTEATVGCVVKEIEPDNNPLIGRPIANTQIYLLDRDLNLVPEGVAGELCIGGAGLARGYLNRPELTAEKFVQHPFRPGERIYRSGDLARWTPKGELEYLGRIDEQVKIRGYRIETGEIEAMLHLHPEVQQAVVIARTLAGPDKVLIAYTTGPARPDVLRDYLQTRLPSYMVPGYYVQLVHIPLTSNGKVNRKSLPLPEESGLSSAAYVAPITATEKKLVSIWSKVLDIAERKLSTHANFFDLGGHSLKVIRLLDQIHQEMGIRLPLKDIFEAGTIAKIAGKISLMTVIENEHDYILFNTSDRAQFIFYLPPLVGLPLGLDMLFTDMDDFNSYGLVYSDKEDFVESSLKIILSLTGDANYISLVGYSAGGNIAFEIVKRLEAHGIKVDLIVLIDARLREGKEEVDEADIAAQIKYWTIESPETAHFFTGNEQYIAHTIKSYARYIANTVNTGVVNAPIVNMISEDAGKNINHQRWKEATTGTYSVITAMGKHEKLFFREHLKANTAMLKEMYLTELHQLTRELKLQEATQL